MERTIRRLVRLTGLGVITTLAFVEFAVTIAGRRGPNRERRLSRWIQRQAGRFARVLGLRMQVWFQRHTAPLFVCNHVSYLDIIVLAAARPVRFVAKSEVRAWPWFGWLARCAGTIFIQRRQFRSLADSNQQLANVARQVGGLVLFPEGTSSDGQTVLPFRSSLLAGAAAENLAVLPVWIGYELADGDVARDICWWGDMTLVPHLWRLLGFKEITTTVRFGRPVWHWDRKILAAHLHEAVCDLAEPRVPLPSGSLKVFPRVRSQQFATT